MQFPLWVQIVVIAGAVFVGPSYCELMAELRAIKPIDEWDAPAKKS